MLLTERQTNQLQQKQPLSGGNKNYTWRGRSLGRQAGPNRELLICTKFTYQE